LTDVDLISVLLYERGIFNSRQFGLAVFPNWLFPNFWFRSFKVRIAGSIENVV